MNPTLLPDDQAQSLASSLSSSASVLPDDKAQSLVDSMSGKTQTGNAMQLIQKYFPPDQWDNAYKVMQGESGGKADAVGDNFPINGQTIPSYGLFQIRGLPGRPAPQQLVDPEFNVQYAAHMFKQQGWGPWTAARKLGLTK